MVVSFTWMFFTVRASLLVPLLTLTGAIEELLEFLLLGFGRCLLGYHDRGSRRCLLGYRDGNFLLLLLGLPAAAYQAIVAFFPLIYF